MENNYYSIDAILAENQVGIIPLPIVRVADEKIENPMHVQARYSRHGLFGWRKRARCNSPSHHSVAWAIETRALDQSAHKNATAVLASTNAALFVACCSFLALPLASHAGLRATHHATPPK